MHDGGSFSSGSFDHGSSHSSFNHTPSHSPAPNHTPSPTHHTTPSHQPPHHPTPAEKHNTAKEENFDNLQAQLAAQQALVAQIQQDRVNAARQDHEKAMADSFLFGKPDPDRITNRKPRHSRDPWWKKFFTKEWWINR